MTHATPPSTPAPGRTPRLCPDWYHEDNVFPSRARMDWAHRPIVLLAARALARAPGPTLDLGCGNGALLRKVHALVPRCTPFGIDRREDRIAHARTLLPAFASHFAVGDLLEPRPWPVGDGRFALALLAPRRLQEAGPARSARLLDWLRAHCDRLLVYGYGTSLTEFGGLGGLARATGLTLEGPAPPGRAAMARLEAPSPPA